MKTSELLALHAVFPKVIEFASFAAVQAFDLARFADEEPDPEWDMGLWETFRAEFPKETTPVDYDLAIRVASDVYKQTIAALAKAAALA